jgi:hypothetical protein
MYGPFVADDNGITVRLTEGQAMYDTIYIRRSQFADMWTWDPPGSWDQACNSADGPCSLTGAGEYYVTLKSVGGLPTKFTVEFQYSKVCPAGSTAHLEEVMDLDPGEWSHYGPYTAGPDGIDVSLLPNVGNVDLYVRLGSAPTSSAYDCRSANSGTTAEACKFSGSGIYYVAAQAIENATADLSVDFGSPGLDPATCSDGIQNQDETGVDCGGSVCDPCAPVCSAYTTRTACRNAGCSWSSRAGLCQ